MRRIVFVLACLHYMSYGQLMPSSAKRLRAQSAGHLSSNTHGGTQLPSKVFAALLLGCNLATAFNPSTLGVGHYLIRHVQVPKFKLERGVDPVAQPSPPFIASTIGSRLSPVQMAPSATVFALDFDGVVCDSEPESSLSGWRHGLELFPDIFGTPEAGTQKARVMQELRQVRPVVETGFENTILARALLEQLPGHSVSDIIAGWGSLMPGLMDRWGLERADMVTGYGKIRDDWMAQDLAGWLAPNRVYPGVAEACIAAEESPSCNVFIVTTKQTRFARAIMSENGNLNIPEDRVFSQTMSGLPKTVVLADLAQGATPGSRKVFVEDKLSTLEKVCSTDGLEEWELFLVDWGYNTLAERDRAAANPRIKVIGVEEFVTMLRDAAAAA